MSHSKQSGRQIAVANLERFKSWITERNAAKDWGDYLRGGKLNRSEIATECGFALSVLRQNPAVKEVLETLESKLRDEGVLSCVVGPESSDGVSEASARATDKRIMTAKAQAEARVKVLEEQNATLRAEIGELKEQLIRFKHLDDHLSRTGRLLPL